MSHTDFEAEQDDWLAEQFDGLTVELDHLTPSEWAEKRRYLPPSVAAMPGYYRFETTPYLREIVDCLSVDSPIREVALMKGVQIGATVGVLENAIGYAIDFVKTAPVMLVTADAERPGSDRPAETAPSESPGSAPQTSRSEERSPATDRAPTGARGRQGHRLQRRPCRLDARRDRRRVRDAARVQRCARGP